MTHERILGLFKFGKREHMEQLVREGHLYMRPLSDFVSMEQDGLRGDNYEALAHSIAADRYEISLENNGSWTRLGTINGALTSPDPEQQKTNVFCLHALVSSRIVSQKDNLIDPRSFDFGDAFVAFKDTKEFLRRVGAQAKNLGLVVQIGLVDYVDRRSYRGPIGIFRKYSTFSYQSEYRLAVSPGIGYPYSLRVGDLSDIAGIGTLAEINRRIRVISPEAKQQGDGNVA